MFWQRTTIVIQSVNPRSMTVATVFAWMALWNRKRFARYSKVWILRHYRAWTIWSIPFIDSNIHRARRPTIRVLCLRKVPEQSRLVQRKDLSQISRLFAVEPRRKSNKKSSNRCHHRHRLLRSPFLNRYCSNSSSNGRPTSILSISLVHGVAIQTWILFCWTMISTPQHHSMTSTSVTSNRTCMERIIRVTRIRSYLHYSSSHSRPIVSQVSIIFFPRRKENNTDRSARVLVFFVLHIVIFSLV